MKRDWLVFAIGAYGAVVATLTALYQFVRERPGVKVVLMPISWFGEDAEEPVDLWEIRAVNHRKRPITIQSAGLLRQRRVHAHGLLLNREGQRVEDPFPVALADGEALEIFIDRTGIFHDAIGAWARDALNRFYHCRYPPRNPRGRLATWRERRLIKRRFRESERQRTPV
jgi:hypothetical protein